MKRRVLSTTKLKEVTQFTNMSLNPNNLLIPIVNFFSQSLIYQTNQFPANTVNDAHKMIGNTQNLQKTLFTSDTAIASTTYEFAVFAKAAEYGFVSVGGGFSSFGTWRFHCFNLKTGTINGGNMANAQMVPQGNGWYRCSAQATSTVGGGNSFQIKLHPNDNAVAQGFTFVGDGTSGIFVWGAELFIV